ncbi:unnamed protein product [Bemisia tabaci]|uniref:Glucose-methanol-choline oxidoreductase N-terminal domain-containing protein n=1 Tax=Bemisia tabaci TaxID=7038 RepID=A0A9N9ZZE4_BEMTA|nr:unnamed protein product [Bemisia tabaci]
MSEHTLKTRKRLSNLIFLSQCLLISVLVAGQARPASAEAYTIFQAVLQYYRNCLNLPPGVVREPAKIYPEYDFIVVGAGSGGSVVVNRLTEEPDWNVLLLEAGKEEILLTDVPLLVSYIIHTDFNWGYKTERSDRVFLGMEDQQIKWPRGKVMGGSSVLNYMVYSRGCKADFDEWASLGNYGWSYEEVLPYFKKSEDMDDPDLAGSPWHGTGGYLRVSRPNWHSPASHAFLEAGREVGYDIVDQSKPVPIGFSYVMSTTKDGARLSAAKAFLRPIRKRQNMHVLKEARVTKVVIDPVTKSTVGVEFIRNRRRVMVRARKEVILAAGTLNSPQILMLSGIGPREHLDELGIDVIEDLPVGYNLQDHVSANGLVFLVNSSVSVIESRFTQPRYLAEYLLQGKGPLTLPGGTEGIAFTLTKYSNDTSRPDMEIVFSPGAVTGDTGGSLRKVLSFSEELYDRVYRPYEGMDAVSLVPILLRPYSKGYVRLRSKNPLHWPKFYPNYYSDERDVWRIVEGIKQRESLPKNPRTC